MAKYVLYHTEGCHLCELAHEMVTQLIPVEQFQLVDIVSDDALMSAYQTSIPVLKRISDQQALFWPFDQQQIAQLVE
jgi:hypothetical protein